METTLIYVQLPQLQADQVIKVITEELKEETHHEAFQNMVSFRGVLLRKLLGKIEELR